MLNEDARERYLRHILLKEVGAQGQQKLLSARVLVVGGGGLGAAIIPYLAAAGIGRLGIADDDRIELSNLQRQTIYRDADIGAPKVERAAAFARALNPSVEAVGHPVKLSAQNAAAIVAEYDMVVEGVDSFDSRFAINGACVGLRKTLVSAAIGRFEGQLSVFKPWAGEKLPCYRCLVPEAPPRETVLSCAEEGVLGPLAGVIGSMAALETLKEILGIGESLAGRLLIYDGLSSQARTVVLPHDPDCSVCKSIDREGGKR